MKHGTLLYRMLTIWICLCHWKKGDKLSKQSLKHPLYIFTIHLITIFFCFSTYLEGYTYTTRENSNPSPHRMGRPLVHLSLGTKHYRWFTKTPTQLSWTSSSRYIYIGKYNNFHNVMNCPKKHDIIMRWTQYLKPWKLVEKFLK